MSVTILTARAHRLFAPVVEALGQCAKKGEDVLLLVPEQFTLAAERGVMERLSLTGMFLIDVMSPPGWLSRCGPPPGGTGASRWMPQAAAWR